MFRAIKDLLINPNIINTDEDLLAVFEEMKIFFKINKAMDILPHFYNKFEKEFIAIIYIYLEFCDACECVRTQTTETRKP